MADAQLPDPATDVKDVLLRTNDEFKQLVTEHHNLDERIRYFSSYPYLSDQQQYEEISLKKQKLALKDRIEAIIRGEHGIRH
jgi:uncharacterized protein YdcH (DUF465 family)